MGFADIIYQQEPATSGYITSPGYPNIYPSSQNWTWSLIADSNHTIIALLYKFKTSTMQCNVDSCWCNDAFQFQFTQNISSIGMDYCTPFDPAPLIYGNSRFLHIIFRSAAAVEPNSGFRLGYSLCKYY